MTYRILASLLATLVFPVASQAAKLQMECMLIANERPTSCELDVAVNSSGRIVPGPATMTVYFRSPKPHTFAVTADVISDQFGTQVIQIRIGYSSTPYSLPAGGGYLSLYNR